ncbi:MAG: CelD/BcsL family acetyltransferase involved in cellulose biosynthesis, partial [Pirellulaceae bacterium]
DQLTSEHWDLWAHWQATNPELISPYFHPDFARAVGSVRDDVEVAVLSKAGETVGLFPYQRTKHHAAKPLGGRLSDYQAVIGDPELTFCARQLIRSCGLSVWDFDHVLTSQTPFKEHTTVVDLSPYLDLSQGFENYQSRLSKTGASELKQTLRKSRKLEREVGKLRLEFAMVDDTVFKLMVQWKSAQYQETQITDVFSFPWTVKLLRRLLDFNSPQFAGALGVLYAGDDIVGVHMGMRSQRVLHWWFPTYNPQFAQYSPGRILLLHLAQSCHAEGIDRLDLGRGVVPYKKRAMSGATSVSQGTVELRPVHRMVREGWRVTREWLRNSPLRGPARIPARMFYRLREWMEFR